MNKQSKIAVIVLNWNGEEDSLVCIAALRAQTRSHTIVAVDNGSTDGFVEKVRSMKDIVLLENDKNLGFDGGVNTGIQYALAHEYDAVALVNNDAVPEPTWLEHLANAMVQTKSGITTGKLLKTDGLIDSTGDYYTTWGLAYPRGRNTKDTGEYDEQEEVFGGSGGASLYSSKLLREIGLFDEDFFAYYEDVDISFRAQLTGWKVLYVPGAIAHHKVGASSSKVAGFTTYHTVKNLPWVFWKNVPLRLIPLVLPRFVVAYSAIVLSSVLQGKILPVLKGLFITTILLPKKLLQRRRIQSKRKVSVRYIRSMLVHDLPPNAHKLRRLRFWRK